MTEKSAHERWLDASHAMQSGVAMEMEIAVRLLIAKGVVTEAEYLETIAEGMEAEKRDYEIRLSEILGNKVTLK